LSLRLDDLLSSIHRLETEIGAVRAVFRQCGVMLATLPSVAAITKLGCVLLKATFPTEASSPDKIDLGRRPAGPERV
jgi:hypothetical protein